MDKISVDPYFIGWLNAQNCRKINAFVKTPKLFFRGPLKASVKIQNQLI